MLSSASPKSVNTQEATQARDSTAIYLPDILTCIPTKQLKFIKSKMGLWTTAPTPHPRVSLSLQGPKFQLVKAKIKELALVSLFPSHPNASAPGNPVDCFQNTSGILPCLLASVTSAPTAATTHSRLDDCICALTDLHASSSGQMHP